MSQSREITPADVRHIAMLARLNIPDDQLSMLASEMASILHHFDALAQVDVTDVEPMAHPLDRTNCLRDDSPGPMLSRDEALRNAPAVEQNLIAVAKTLDEGQA